MTVVLVIAAGFVVLVGLALIWCLCWMLRDRAGERARMDTTRRREQEEATVYRLYPRAVSADVTLVPPDSDDAA